MRLPLAILAILLPTLGAHASGKLLDAFSGRKVLAYQLYALAPNCKPLPLSVILFDQPVSPKHGQLSWTNALVPTHFPAANVRSACNGAARPGVRVWYQSQAGYHGSDAFTLVVTFPSGKVQTISRPVMVH